MIKELSMRVDDITGESITLTPSFKVNNHSVSIWITKNEVSVWVDDFASGGEGPLTIINTFKYYNKYHRKNKL